MKANLLTGLGADQVYSRAQSSTTSHVISDALGTTVAVTDATGVVTTAYTYEPYGNTSQTGASNENTQQYTARENDGTGLYYYRARYYSPLTGRFVAEDPIGLAGGINPYAYVEEDPVSYTDAEGLARAKIGGKVIDVHKADADPWPSVPHGHEYDANQVIDAEGNIYDKATKQKVGQLPKKQNQMWKKFLKKLPRAAKCLAPFFFAYDWYKGGLPHAVDEVMWPVSEAWQ